MSQTRINMATEIVCENCGHIFQGEFCNKCGQQVFKRFSGLYLWHGLREDLFEIESGLLLTFKELWTHPGIMVLNYINGKTKRYYSPLKYLIFWTAAYLILIPFTTRSESRSSIIDLMINSHSPFSRESLDDFISFWVQLMKMQTNIYFLGLIPFLSVINYSFHQANKFNLIEILILHTYFCGQFAFVIIIFTSLTPLFISFEIAGFKIMDLLLQLPYWYLFIRMQKEFFSETWNKAILKGIVILIVGTATYLFFLFLLFNGMKYVL